MTLVCYFCTIGKFVKYETNTKIVRKKFYIDFEK